MFQICSLWQINNWFILRGVALNFLSIYTSCGNVSIKNLMFTSSDVEFSLSYYD